MQISKDLWDATDQMGMYGKQQPPVVILGVY